MFCHCLFQQLLQLSSDTVLPPISHLFAISFVLCNLLAGIDLRNWCLLWLLSSLTHLCITVLFRILHLIFWGLAAFIAAVYNIHPVLRGLTILFTVPRWLIITFIQPWGRVLTLWQRLLRVPKQVSQSSKIHNASKWRLSWFRMAPVCTLGTALTQAFLASERATDGQRLLS